MISCAPNFRPVAGLPSRFGGFVRPGKIYRAEAVCSISDDDAECLARLGIRLVCDLRSEWERAAASSYWLRSGVEVLPMTVSPEVPTGEGSAVMAPAGSGAAAALRVMMHIYASLPAACARHLAILFDRLSRGDLPMLIHCTAGKDRTGFVIAMLLHATGVQEDAIFADYLASNDRASASVIDATRRFMEQGMNYAVDEEALAVLSGVREEFLLAAFARASQEFGDLDGYLREAVRLDPQRRALLASLLLTEH